MPLFVQEHTLLEAFRAGQKQALSRVYCFYLADVYRLAASGFVTAQGQRVGRLEREADRLDFVQDVFVRAFSAQARATYDAERAYRPFLLRIARNLRIDRARKQGREPAGSRLSVPVDEHAHIDDWIERSSVLATDGEAEVELGRQRLYAETASIVANLAQDVQQLAHLRFVEDLSQADAAERLCTTRRRVRTLESRLFRSVKQGLSLHELSFGRG